MITAADGERDRCSHDFGGRVGGGGWARRGFWSLRIRRFAEYEVWFDTPCLNPQRGAADLWATASSADLRFCFYVLLCLCVWVYAIVGLWGCVSVWISVLWVCVCVCVCVFTCLCLFGCCVFLCDHV